VVVIRRFENVCETVFNALILTCQKFIMMHSLDKEVKVWGKEALRQMTEDEQYLSESRKKWDILRGQEKM